jgi:predicted methyltransferase
MEEHLGHYVLGPNATEENGIYVGDAESLGLNVPDNSVDMIFCDPVYDEYGQYYWLAHFAERVLKPGKSVLAQVGSLHRRNAEEKFYWWPEHDGKMQLEPRILLFERLMGGHTQVWKPRALACLKTYLWFAKPGPKQKGWIPELVTGGGRRKRTHVWGDSTQAAETWISRFTEEGEVVVDPFAGSGMVQIACIRTGRRYLGFEIDPERVKNARADCARAQAPLIPAGNQLAMAIDE